MRFRFEKREIKDMALSTIFLSFLFSYRYLGIVWADPLLALSLFFQSLFLIAPSFLLHEIAHKFVAQHYGCEATYIMFPHSLAFSLLLAFLTDGGVVLAAPGAVFISTAYPIRLGFKFVHLTYEETGKIALAGPLTNLLLFLLFNALSPISPYSPLYRMNYLSFCAMINLMLALWNLLPIPPLDGGKVFRWSPIGWGTFFFASLILFFLFPFLSPILCIFIALFLILFLFLIGQRYVPKVT